MGRHSHISLLRRSGVSGEFIPTDFEIDSRFVLETPRFIWLQLETRHQPCPGVRAGGAGTSYHKAHEDRRDREAFIGRGNAPSPMPKRKIRDLRDPCDRANPSGRERRGSRFRSVGIPCGSLARTIPPVAALPPGRAICQRVGSRASRGYVRSPQFALDSKEVGKARKPEPVSEVTIATTPAAPCDKDHDTPSGFLAAPASLRSKADCSAVRTRDPRERYRVGRGGVTE
jgi:hypothetical protein